MNGEADRRTIRPLIDGKEVEIQVDAEHAERVDGLLRRAAGFEAEWASEPETVAARLTAAVDPDEPGLAFARTMIAHSDSTGDREGPLQGVGAFMLSHGSVLADLAMLLRWLQRQGSLDPQTADRLGLREDALENIDRLVEEIDYPAGPSDLSYEMQVRALMRQLTRHLDRLQEDGGSVQDRIRMLLLLASGQAANLDEAAAAAGEQQPEG